MESQDARAPIYIRTRLISQDTIQRVIKDGTKAVCRLVRLIASQVDKLASDVVADHVCHRKLKGLELVDRVPAA